MIIDIAAGNAQPLRVISRTDIDILKRIITGIEKIRGGPTSKLYPLANKGAMPLGS
jgi:hypothetical protein